MRPDVKTNTDVLTATAALTNETRTATKNKERTNLTISLYHVAAVVADISKELHRKRNKNRNSCC